MTSTQTTTDRQHAPYEIEVLAPGQYQGLRIGADDLELLAENFAKLKGTHDVPVAVRLGHDDHQVLAQETGAPAFGWAEQVYVKGGKLWASIVGMPGALRDAISRGAWRKTSAGLYPCWQLTEAESNLRTGVRGPVLQHIAYLGVDVPRIRSLADLPRVLADEGHAEEVILCMSDPPSKAPLTDGALSVRHHVSSVRHNAKHATQHLAQLTSHANDLADLLDVDTKEPDADADDTAPLSLHERLARAEAMLTTLRQRNHAAAVVLAEAATKPKTFGSFDAQSAPEDLQSLGGTFCDSVDGELQRHNLTHDNAAARRRVAEAVLKSWKEKANPFGPGTMADALDSADFERAVTGYAKNANGGVLAHAEGALPSVDAGGGIEAQFRISVEQTMADRGWPVEDVQKRKEAARIVLDEYQRLPADLRYGDGDSLASQVTDAVYSTVVYGTATAAGRPASDQKERGVTQATESTRGFAQMSESTPKRTNAPLYGGRAVAADSYGGQRNYARLLVFASDHGLRLSRTDDRRRAEKLLLAELGDDAPIALSENGTAPKPTMYGSRGRSVPTPTAREVAFTENALARLRTIPVDVEGRVGRAWREQAQLNPALCPDYGWNTRARRARG